MTITHKEQTIRRMQNMISRRRELVQGSPGAARKLAEDLYEIAIAKAPKQPGSLPILREIVEGDLNIDKTLDAIDKKAAKAK